MLEFALIQKNCCTETKNENYFPSHYTSLTSNFINNGFLSSVRYLHLSLKSLHFFFFSKKSQHKNSRPLRSKLLIIRTTELITYFISSSALILDSIDGKKGSVKGLCMAEAKRGKVGKEGEASRFLKVIVEVLKCKISEKPNSCITSILQLLD